MSEYEALRTEIERMGTSYVAYAAAVDRYAEVVNEQVAGLWADNAELRDELDALANRVETLTRVALNPYHNYCGRRDCGFTEPHYHDPADGHVIINHAERGFIRLAADLKDEPA